MPTTEEVLYGTKLSLIYLNEWMAMNLLTYSNDDHLISIDGKLIFTTIDTWEHKR
jgi:hypothetical protein